MGGGGGKGGGGGGGGSSAYEDAMAGIATDLYKSTSGLRSSSLSQLQGIQNGNYNVSDLPAYKPLYAQAKSGLESQYQNAKSNIMGSTQSGGALTSALANLEGDRASNVGSLSANLSSNIVSDLMNKAYGTAWGAPSQSMSGLSQANAGWTSRANAQSAADAQANASSMGLLGSLGTGAALLALK